MTFNIWNYNRPWTRRRALIADLILQHRPDVVALQETRHDWRYERGKGQGEQLAELTGYHPAWALGQVYFPGLRVDEGLTTLTPAPPLRAMSRELTKHRRDRGDRNQRVCLGVTVEVDARRVDVFNSHFSLSPTARETNALEAATFIREVSGRGPALLMGDLNALPDTPPIRFLLGQAELQGQTGDFIDCWKQVHPNQPGFTYGSFHPTHTIDYVLARTIRAVRSAQIVGGEAVDGVYPSDHMGLVVELDP
jgi:endonuclease/exonuclease/phosphatase family metal-dependent hydrolase